MQLGIERLVSEENLIKQLSGKKVALVASPASVDHKLNHSADLLFNHPDINLVAAFGAQHGLRGEKQDNMVESDDYVDPTYGIPVFSLYGETRRPTDKMMQPFDVMLFDLQDVGCRIYTFITTLLYCLEESAKHGKEIWVLDRPNPAGRPIEGMTLLKGQESFVGAGPMPMRHGLTVGELANWFVEHYKIDVSLKVIEMKDYHINEGPGFGWPQGELAWVNPSPNAPTLNMARAFPGTVMLEGTTLSEGRGVTRALELVGASDIDAKKIYSRMQELAPHWLEGALIRECFFEPTFHKHQGKLCHGLMLHTDTADYDHGKFKPFRFIALFLKAVRLEYPNYEIWRDFEYEYEFDRLPIDVINGSSALREWVDNASASVESFDNVLLSDEKKWEEERRAYLLY